MSDWSFPNNNHIRSPSMTPADPWMRIGVWNVPVDDENTVHFLLYVIPGPHGESQKRVGAYMDSRGDYDPAQHHDDLVHRKVYPDDLLIKLTNAQDYVAIIGQGPIADRENEWLGYSDMGAMIRKIFNRELDAIEHGKPLKTWRRLDVAEELPDQSPEPAAVNA